jgi:hypothetical protein
MSIVSADEKYLGLYKYRYLAFPKGKSAIWWICIKCIQRKIETICLDIDIIISTYL